MVVKARLDQVNLVVQDMEAMAAFYGRLGLDLGADGKWASHHRSAKDAEGIDLDLDSEVFASRWNTGWAGGSGIVLTFRTESRQDVDDLYAELSAAGSRAQQEPYDAFWGSRFAVVTDPDGNAVGIMSPPEAAHRTPPPEPPE